jgi:5,6-dimethylbenzimidazole synthase
MDAADSAPEFDVEFRQKFAELLAWRRDVRKFRTEPLPEGSVERLLHFACLAPSVGLSQPWRFVFVASPEKRARIRENFACANAEALASYCGERAARYATLKLEGLREAPVQLAVFAEPDPERGAMIGRRTMPETVAYSVVAAIHTLWLVARAEGIGMGWVSILDPAPLTRDLDLPRHWQFIGYFCLGFPAEPAGTPELERLRWENRADPSSLIFRR